MQTLLNHLSGRLRITAVLSFICLTTLLAGNALATDWYVSPNGHNQNNTGRSAESAYRTIQRATDAALPGDVVNVMAGTYREQVDIKAGVTFQAVPGQTVVVNGAQVLIGWTPEAGSTYRTSAMNWDVDPKFGSNQLFQDKTMIELLRWPKQTSADIIMPTNAEADAVTKLSETSIMITDSDFTEGDGRWNGAKIWINLSRNGSDGQGWTGTVISTSGNTITVDWGTAYSLVFGDEPYGFGPKQEYFLFDPTPQGVAIAGIDHMLGLGEWWKNTTTNTVYVKTRNGQAPSATGIGSQVIEAKRRHFGFWSSTDTKTDYTIDGFKLFACSVTTVPDPFLYRHNHSDPALPLFAKDVTNVTLNNLDFTYPSHQTDMSGNYQAEHVRWTGVVLHGRNSVIQNCKIRYTATSALSIMGENLRVLNNEFESTNYFCSNAGTINTGFYLRDAEIGYNKIWNTTVIAIYFNYSKNSNPAVRDQFRIHHNKIWDFLRRSDDSGAIDMFGVDGQWMRIDHNVIFNTGIDSARFRFQKAAIYLDYGGSADYAGRITIDHNVVYNVLNTILLNEVNDVHIFNNVLLSDEYNGKKATIEGHTNESKENGASTFGKGVKLINNIMSHPPNRDPSDATGDFRLAEAHNNIMNATIGSDVLKSLFVDPSNPNMAARDYRLKDGSPAIDKGVSVGMYDVGIIEEPDLGAYEKGANGSGTDTTPPSQPAVPSVSNAEGENFTLTWPATTDVGGGVAYYELSTPEGTPQLPTRYPEVSTINVKGLNSSTDYTFELVAVDGMGNRSVPTTFNVRSADQFVDVTIPKTATAPGIDGIREAGVYTGPVTAIAKLIQPGTLPANAADFSANWTASWDDNNLYVHVAVVDDIRMNNSKDWYNDDNVEIFINGNGLRPQLPSSTDYHLYIRPGGTLQRYQNNIGSSSPPQGIEAIAPNAPGSSTHYTVEVKIPFSVLGITTSAELQQIGIEVNVGDDDGGSVRKMVWKNESWQSPSRFSLAQFTPLLFDRTDAPGTGTVTARGEKNTDEGWEKAFDNDKLTKWMDFSTTSWIQFQFPNSAKYAITRYTVTSANDVPGRDPKDWKLYGTNKENPAFPADFTEIDSQSGVSFVDRHEKRGYAVNPSVEYSTYRLVIMANNGAPWTQLAEIELFAPDGTTPLKVSPASASIEVGEKPQQLSANQAVIWSSSDESVVKVSSRGVLTAVAGGTATITATSSTDNTKTTTVAITVIKPLFDRTDPVNSGVVSAKGEDTNAGLLARYAFDNNKRTKWLDKSNTSWIQFKFSEDGSVKYAVAKYTITSANDESGSDPKNWTLYGTNAANPVFPADFNQVDSQSGVIFAKRGERQTFTIGNTTEYSTYRLDITANNGAPFTQLAEIELFAPASTTAPPVVTLTPATATVDVGEQQTLKAIISPVEYSSDVDWSSSNTNVATVNSSGVVTAVAIGTATITAKSKKDNTLTGTVAITIVKPSFDRTDPVNSGIVSAAGADDGLVARNAFDNVSYIKWLHKSTTSWIQFKFSEDGLTKYAVAKYTITSANDVPGRDPKDWTLYGTNVANPTSLADFTEVDSQSGVTFAERGEKQTFTIGNTTEYSTYRLDITANNGAPWIQLAEIELFAPASTTVQPVVTLTPATATVKVGEQQRLKTFISPVEYSSDMDWSSSNTNVATVNSSGVVTAVAVGTATITAKSKKDNTLIGTATIKAVQVPTSLVDRTDPVNAGVVSAQGSDDNLAPRNAFDNTNAKWLHKSNTSWIQFTFAEDGSIKYAVAKYTITSANDIEGRDPKNWMLYGTNVANPVFPADFTQVDSQSGVTFAKRGEKQEFFISNNTTEYSTYRLDITANNGAPWTQLDEIELFAPDAIIVVDGLTVTDAKPTSFNLNWNALGGTTESYEIFRDNISIGITTATTFQVGSLLPGSTYNMTVKARNTAGSESDPSAVLSVTTPTAGALIREYWANVAGSTVSSIPVNTKPTSVSVITSLEDPTPSSYDAIHNNFGQRIRGYIVPSITATYYFYIASDNDGAFWLSTDDKPANKGTVPIAKLLGSTGKQEWTKHLANQKSAGKALVAGKKYYFEALMKESGGNNNLSIGWTTATNNTGITVVGSSNLEAYMVPSCSTCRPENAEVARTQQTQDLTLKLYPNPASREVTISLAGFEEESAVEVKMSDMTGKTFVGKQVQLSAGFKEVTLPVSHLPQGLFFVKVQGAKTAKTAKLVITK